MIRVSNGIKTFYAHAIEQSSTADLATMHRYVWFIHLSQMRMLLLFSDATKFHYKIRNWYSPQFYVEIMIMQYAGMVKIPTFEELTMMRLFPTRIMLLAGKD
jgi:hypothetical protein